jgi:hypothetical protein
MDKDIKLLRDLWFYIDPNSPISKEHVVFQFTRIQVEYVMRRKVDKEGRKSSISGGPKSEQVYIFRMG